MSDDQVTFYSRDALMARSASDVVAQAGMVARIMKAALLRQEDAQRTMIGYELDADHLYNQPPSRTYTWNFNDPVNRDVVTRAYVPHARDILSVAAERKITAIPAAWGPQLIYAVEQGTVARWSFNEISGIINPPAPRPSAQILPFRKPTFQPRVA